MNIDWMGTSSKESIRLISKRMLSNGNQEYRFATVLSQKLPCIEIFEVDPQTGIILKADFEGTEKNCYIIP